MSRIDGKEIESNVAITVARMMAASARTAPKTQGVDCIETMIIDGEELELLASAMEHKAEIKNSYITPALRRDANCVRKSNCVLLIGVTGNPKRLDRPLDCGACGYTDCAHLAKISKQRKIFTGPTCVFQGIDLGIALGSAVKIAAELNIDNRVMYTIGIAVSDLGWMGNSTIIIGIPLSVNGKNPYFDRQ